MLRVVIDTPATRLWRPLAAARGLLAARRALRQAVPALADWARAAGPGDVAVEGLSVTTDTMHVTRPPTAAGAPAGEDGVR